jgi:hypothetical protein
VIITEHDLDKLLAHAKTLAEKINDSLENALTDKFNLDESEF